MKLWPTVIMWQASQYNWPANAEDFGYVLGRTLSHEMGHTFSLFDEYIASANTAPYYNTPATWPPRTNLMGEKDFNNKTNNTVVTDEMYLQFILAFDDPTLQEREFGFIPGAQRIAGTPKDVADQLIEYIRMLDHLDIYNYPGRAAQSLSAPAGPDPGREPDLAQGPAPSAGGAAGAAVTDTAGAPLVPDDVKIESPPVTGDLTTGVGDGITNGTFGIDDPYSAVFGWSLQGAAGVEQWQGVLTERAPLLSGLSQTFVVPDGVETLMFTILSANLGDSTGHPADAFEAALLDAGTMTPIVDVAGGLSDTDAFLNIQASGQAYTGPQVTLSGPGTLRYLDFYLCI